MNVLVALSGGVDSSVAAFLLKEQGHDPVGIRFQLWTDPRAPAFAQILPNKCCNAQTVARSKWVADTLQIPFHVVDLSREFQSHVVDPFLESYRRGETPNPCIACNRVIKFAELLKHADRLGCDAIATGHYARTTATKEDDGTDHYHLLRALDAQKDQSYYLYGLTQAQLKRTLFPLGGMRKTDVMKLAKKFRIPVDEQYRESQDLCFFPEKEPTAFLHRYIPDAIVPGAIVRENGEVAGTHAGLPLYTVGQRRGLGIGGLRIPLEVVRKNTERNELVVAERGSVRVTDVPLVQLHWISKPPHSPYPLECQTRSLTERVRGTLEYEADTAVFHFAKPHEPLTPGQSMVLYEGEEVMGGGIMAAKSS